MMEYGRLGTAESRHTFPEFESLDQQLAALEEQQLASARRRRARAVLLTLLAAVFLVASAASIAALLQGTGTAGTHRPTVAIQEACRYTGHTSLCLASLSSFPPAKSATGTRDLFHASLNLTMQRVSRALYGASEVATATGLGDLRLRTAYQDCVELMEDSVDYLSRSLSVSSSRAAAATAVGKATEDDVHTWLSAALTNQDTCLEGFDGVAEGHVKAQIMARIKDLSELVSNCLAIFSAVAKSQEFAGIPIQNRRRKLMEEEDGPAVDVATDGFPRWMTRSDRRLLQIPGSNLNADFIVSKTGNGTHKSIAQAVQDAPDNSTRRFIIYIRAGRYDENIKVARKKTNLMFVGEGKGVTIIAGSRSVYDNYTTFHTATFAATGAGFIARDITFQNWAGPDRHQAVALRVGADHAVIFRCNVIGYQDTLYVHSQRQFFRECDIYGTVDFIFGNAAVVLQNCSLYARKPLPMQKNTITAQNRKDPNQNTGISIHACRILATPDLQAAGTANYSTYLGRPWKLYSRAVVMMSYIAGHVHPNGWLEWNTTFALDTLYYGEYMNFGPGAAVAKRVTWPGYHVITQQEEANRFTVSQFITGSTWLPSTGVSFLAGLSL